MADEVKVDGVVAGQLVTSQVNVDDVKKYVDIFSKILDFGTAFIPADNANVRKIVDFTKDLLKQDWAVELLTVLVNNFHQDAAKQEELKKVATELVAAAKTVNESEHKPVV